MIAQQRVNVEKARDIGVKILQSMAGTSTKEFTFRKANQAVTFGSRSTVKVEGEPVNVDPQLLFQQHITLLKSSSLMLQQQRRRYLSITSGSP